MGAAGSFGYLGLTRDTTAAVVARLGGAPTAPSTVDLGALVAELFASTEEDVVPSVNAVTIGYGD